MSESEDELEFLPSRAYKGWKVKGKCLGDGREVALLRYIYAHPQLDKMRGNPHMVCQVIDGFARTQVGLLNIGENKGEIVCRLITQFRPVTMLELGTYVGYSAILFGHTLRREGGKRYITIEKDPLFAAVAASLVDLAGLSNIVRVVVGEGGEVIRRLHQEHVLPSKVGAVFFDHDKDAYAADLKLCEQLGIVSLGTLLVANSVRAESSAYLAYVRAKVAEKQEWFQNAGTRDKGNPKLQYATRSTESYLPDGRKEQEALEFSECLGEED